MGDTRGVGRMKLRQWLCKVLVATCLVGANFAANVTASRNARGWANCSPPQPQALSSGVSAINGSAKASQLIPAPPRV